MLVVCTVVLKSKLWKVLDFNTSLLYYITFCFCEMHLPHGNVSRGNTALVVVLGMKALSYFSTGEILWTKNYGSPVVAIYKMDNSGLSRVKLNHVAKETLKLLIGANTSNDQHQNTFLGNGAEILLQ